MANDVVVVAVVPLLPRSLFGTVAIIVPPMYGVMVAEPKYLNVMP